MSIESLAAQALSLVALALAVACIIENKSKRKQKVVDVMLRCPQNITIKSRNTQSKQTRG